MTPETSIIVGNLDGVHPGHRRLVETAREAVGPAGRVVALVFDPHPLVTLRPGQIPPGRLTTFEHRTELLKAAGADEIIRLDPTPELLGLSPEEFIGSVCVRHQPAYIVEGPDFRFGRRRAGSVQTLRDLEAAHGYRTLIIEPVEVALADRTVVPAGSSIIRWLLERGRVDDAALALGRPYEIRGAVVQGERRGRALGVPTANLDTGDCLVPADGIYAGHAHRPGVGTWPAAISVGTKPTFGTHPRTCEAHLIGYDGPPEEYGWTMHLRFTHWLRDQLRYRDVEALVAQIRRDIRRAEALVSHPRRTSLAGS